MPILIKEIGINGENRSVFVETRLRADDGEETLLRTQTRHFRSERGAENFLNERAIAEDERGVWDKDTSFILGVWWLATKRDATAHEIIELSRLDEITLLPGAT